jgi:hypothetical protein
MSDFEYGAEGFEFCDRDGMDRRLEEIGLVGHLAAIECSQTEGDFATVRRLGREGEPQPPYVSIGVVEDGLPNVVVLTPTDARKYAAAILNAADEADGTPPLEWGAE